MVSKNLIYNVFANNKTAEILAQVLNNFSASSIVKFNNLEYNLKSSRAFFNSAITFGDSIELICNGQDELGALVAAEKILLAEDV